jgi:uncharacterized membrane protein YhaH (DUF805 family)
LSFEPHAIPVPAAGAWHPDPTGRHQYRYHDGLRWTDHVAVDGQVAQDPIAAPLVPPTATADTTDTGQVGPFSRTWLAAGGAYAPPSPARPSTNETVHPEQVGSSTPPGGVTWQEATHRCLAKFVDFSGRAPRSEYWWFYLTVMAAFIIASLISETLGTLIILGLFLPNLAASVRRLHDTGKSGWWLLIGLIPIVGPILLIVWLASAGARQANVYGPPMTV